MQKTFYILPNEVADAIKKLDFKNLQEIRLRADKPVCVLYNFNTYYLTLDGVSQNKEKAIVLSQNQIENTLLRACQHSLHSFSKQLSNGFIMPFSGVRIGVCGCAVYQNDKIVSFKEIFSLNIRFPHEVKDCSKICCKYLLNPVKNTLIISPPGGGKTTFLRDLIYQTSFCDKSLNVLVADERNEISGCIDGVAQYDLGTFCDVICMAEKSFAFKTGIRTMTPDILVCDEICNDDLESLYDISKNGIKLFCTMHGQGVEDILSNVNSKKIRQIFERYVFLKNKDLTGQVSNVFDEDFNKLI